MPILLVCVRLTPLTPQHIAFALIKLHHIQPSLATQCACAASVVVMQEVSRTHSQTFVYPSSIVWAERRTFACRYYRSRIDGGIAAMHLPVLSAKPYKRSTILRSRVALKPHCPAVHADRSSVWNMIGALLKRGHGLRECTHPRWLCAVRCTIGVVFGLGVPFTWLVRRH